MIRFIRLLIILLVAIILVAFAFANKQWVTVSFDPFGSVDNAAFSIAAPLFAVVITVAALGVIAGAAATWVSQGRHRRAGVEHRARGGPSGATEVPELEVARPGSPALRA